MPGMGTLINVAAIVVGGLGGMLFGKWLKERFQEILTMSCGICVIFIGIAGVMEKMLVYADGRFSSQGTLMLIGSGVIWNYGWSSLANG